MPAPARLHRSDGRTEWVHSGGNYELRITNWLMQENQCSDKFSHEENCVFGYSGLIFYRPKGFLRIIY